jgi:hypothetical protein
VLRAELAVRLADQQLHGKGHNRGQEERGGASWRGRRRHVEGLALRSIDRVSQNVLTIPEPQRKIAG